ncbi:MAG: hypothetical protein M0Z69_00430 [Actinomycetota bacterium]|nr:hypothetical protein [Actinomycetota bacterium]
MPRLSDPHDQLVPEEAVGSAAVAAEQLGSVLDTIDPALLARAGYPRGRPGRLTRRNTASGSPERRAVYRVEYVWRRADLGGGETVRSRLGHGPADRSMPALADHPPRWLDFTGLTRAEARRLARYWSVVEFYLLREGSVIEIADRDREFRRRISRWAPFRGHRLLADPAAIRVLLERRRASGQPVFYYTRGRS